jgi:uncharacterized OsmC-like protein
MNDVITQMRPGLVNGIDVDALQQVVRQVSEDPAKGMVRFAVKSAWQGQTKSRATVESYRIGGQEVKRHFEIDVDEPFELLGQNSAPNPQEMLMTAFNACIMVGYVAGAAVMGVRLEKVEIETSGELDLRGFLGIDPSVPPGYEAIRYTVRMKGDASEAQFREIHDNVLKTSPNYFNIARPIRIDAHLVIEA